MRAFLKNRLLPLLSPDASGTCLLRIWAPSGNSHQVACPGGGVLGRAGSWDEKREEQDFPVPWHPLGQGPGSRLPGGGGVGDFWCQCSDGVGGGQGWSSLCFLSSLTASPFAASLPSLQELRACQPLTQPHKVTAFGLFPQVQHSDLWRARCVSSELSSNLSPLSSCLTLRFPPTYSGADRAGPKVYFIIISGPLISCPEGLGASPWSSLCGLYGGGVSESSVWTSLSGALGIMRPRSRVSGLTGKRVQRLRALAHPPKNQGSILSTQVPSSQLPVILQSRGVYSPLLASGRTSHMWCTDAHKTNI